MRLRYILNLKTLFVWADSLTQNGVEQFVTCQQDYILTTKIKSTLQVLFMQFQKIKNI